MPRGPIFSRSEVTDVRSVRDVLVYAKTIREEAFTTTEMEKSRESVQSKTSVR